jgi:hypothetical protein
MVPQDWSHILEMLNEARREDVIISPRMTPQELWIEEVSTDNRTFDTGTLKCFSSLCAALSRVIDARDLEAEAIVKEDKVATGCASNLDEVTTTLERNYGMELGVNVESIVGFPPSVHRIDKMEPSIRSFIVGGPIRLLALHPRPVQRDHR